MEETMTRGTFQCLVVAAAMLAATAALSRPFFDPRAEKREAIDADPVFSAQARDPACYAAQLASTGGLAPRDPHTLAVRWAGYSNFELAYGGKIILLDAYFDRGSNYLPLGFRALPEKNESGGIPLRARIGFKNRTGRQASMRWGSRIQRIYVSG
jgi:hypothetical protein